MRKRVLVTTGAIALVALIAVPLAFAQRMHAMHGKTREQSIAMQRFRILANSIFLDTRAFC